jgi:anaerobic selenocysteine-containing dehydrogenase
MEVKMPQKGKRKTGEKTYIKALGFSNFGDNSSMAAIDVRGGKIIRIRPFHFDWRYKPEEFRPWKMKARGKVFEPPMKSMLPPFGIGYKKRVHSPNRILYPLKRVDWDPKGERNPQNRGKSGYVRISWDEATDLIASEIKRIHKKYGPEGI